ncbi:hypothetical protein V2B37_12880 [Natranaerobius thermophilus JW/NM-WN-LF]|uniref:Uncharacterized protein n=1 Tax=Natranaerobius thermophilus (strain ATCC BAA-1301 / DSM 18059 / JW/NM-WN-LF) TaxID=457570 RepID=B2A1A0_NATTJ|nr:conserved hypothetical protein [Natranaerobius thermophilus JW/NM-WN-LF]
MIQDKGFKVIVFCLALLLLPAAPIMAHLMLIEPVEDGKIQVVFDDDTIASNAEVTVYNENDEKIKEGEVDENGKFSYPEEAEFIVADDGLGHRAEHAVGEDSNEQLPRELTIGVVLVVLALIAGIFKYRSSKNQKSS